MMAEQQLRLIEEEATAAAAATTTTTTTTTTTRNSYGPKWFEGEMPKFEPPPAAAMSMSIATATTLTTKESSLDTDEKNNQTKSKKKKKEILQKRKGREQHTPNQHRRQPSTARGERRKGHEFVWVSDTQRTSPLEFWRESNDDERKVLIEAIADMDPAFVLMGGDLVFSGSSEADWLEFDSVMEPIRQRRIPVYSAFGNHEYWLDWFFHRRASPMETFFYERFPHLKKERHWYSLEFGPLRLVVLDSNQGHGPITTEEGWSEQKRWFEQTLDSFDLDPEVRGVIVAVHHPPFTNSTITSDEIHVQEAFVPKFVASKKTLIMISGHVHSYERFHKHGKLFVVSGGGGGPRAPLKKQLPHHQQPQPQQHTNSHRRSNSTSSNNNSTSNKNHSSRHTRMNSSVDSTNVIPSSSVYRLIEAYGGYAKHGDAFEKEESIRSFNFIRFLVSLEGMSVAVMGLAKGGHSTFLLDHFDVPFDATLTSGLQ